ncbi:MAG: HD domain-containing protein [Candidatus Aenigmatarchaeota archaeon]
MEKILSLLPNDLKEKYFSIWKEFIEQKSEEAKLVKQLEKLEMGIQALEYKEEGYEKEKFSIFLNDVRSILKDEELKSLFSIIERKFEKKIKY